MWTRPPIDRMLKCDSAIFARRSIKFTIFRWRSYFRRVATIPARTVIQTMKDRGSVTRDTSEVAQLIEEETTDVDDLQSINATIAPRELLFWWIRIVWILPWLWDVCLMSVSVHDGVRTISQGQPSCPSAPHPDRSGFSDRPSDDLIIADSRTVFFTNKSWEKVELQQPNTRV